MDFCDSNVWLALALEMHPQHQAAHVWFDGLGGGRTASFCRATQQTLLRLLSTPALMQLVGLPALTNRAAWNVYEALQSDERVNFVVEPAELTTVWHRFGAVDSPSPKLWMDAYLAAFARASGTRLVTFDSCFRQFSALELLLLA